MLSHRYKIWLFIGALLGGLAVAAGAFGAHGLDSHFSQGGLTADESRLLEVWETAARYQMFHALALLAVGMATARHCGLAINVAGATMTLGTLIFSGCLYALVLSGVKVLGAIVPVGGVLMIVGWVALAVAVWRLPDSSRQTSGGVN
jgi:uncharacterized membrane protein YgdD (TMEM256/DUF423 family)